MPTRYCTACDLTFFSLADKGKYRPCPKCNSHEFLVRKKAVAS